MNMLVVILVITLVFIIINYFVSGRDFSDPAFIFCLAFFAFEFICFLGGASNDVVLIPETVLIISFGFLCITCVSAFAHRNQGYYELLSVDSNNVYDLNNVVVAIVILIQLLTIISFIDYISRLSLAYRGYEESLTEIINTYDKLSKFNTTQMEALNIKPSNIYNRTNLVSNCVPYVILFISINNFVIERRIRLLQLVSVALFAINTVLTGGRSGLFAMFTFALIEFMIISFRKVVKNKGGTRLVLRIIVMTIIVGVLLILVMKLMGRGLPSDLAHYIYVYFGAPIDNLDNYIASGAKMKHTDVPGEYSLNGVYRYFYDKKLLYSVGRITDVLPFVTSANGKNAGNVYTMFYFWLIDFGYLGLLPMMMLYSICYVYTYRRIFRNHKGRFNYSLFLYSFMINSLLMSPFSNRFYEDIITVSFVKKLIVTYLFVIIFIDKRIGIMGKEIRISNNQIGISNE